MKVTETLTIFVSEFLMYGRTVDSADGIIYNIYIGEEREEVNIGG